MMREIQILKSIPTELRRKDIFILEGIRYAFGIIQISYQNLFNELHKASKTSADQDNLNSQIYYQIFKEAWSIIDFGWKLRNLLIQIEHPDEEEKKEEIIDIENEVLNIKFLHQLREFRNTFQHLEKRISEVLVEENTSVWGNISWLYIVNKQELHSCVLFPGHPRSSSEIINPGGLLIKSPICHITLASTSRNKEKIKINISELNDNINQLMDKLELVLKKQFDQMDYSKKFAQDMILTVVITFSN